MKSYVCSSCFAITKRIEGALKPTVCPFCRGTELFDTDPGNAESGNSQTGELLPKAARTVVLNVEPSLAESDERPCERGEPCARLSGIDCPGGRGC